MKKVKLFIKNFVKPAAKLFVIYFPILLVSGQVGVNLLSFIDKQLYMSEAFFLNFWFGTNGFCGLFFIVFVFAFNFCAISRAAAIAECLFGVFYFIIKEDNVYNITFQIIVGSVALVFTLFQYIKKFPLCRLGLLIRFLHDVTVKGDCKKGIEKWERDNKSLILKSHVYNSNRP